MDFQKLTKQIIERSDFKTLYAQLGVRSCGRPTSTGWQHCHSLLNPKDKNPSASFNVRSGYYKDFTIPGKAMSYFDLLVALGKYTNFTEAKIDIARTINIDVSELDKSVEIQSKALWREWEDCLCREYLSEKPPVTVDGIKKTGAVMCLRNGVPCFAIPLFDSLVLDSVSGFTFVPMSGRPFDSGAKSISKGNGLLGLSGLKAMSLNKGLDVYWVEGVTDLFTAYSRFPGEAFVTNPNGCSQEITDKAMKMLDGHEVFFIADADNPGIEGAKNKSKKVERSKILIPPYSISDKHGKDLRDFLYENPEADLPKNSLTIYNETNSSGNFLLSMGILFTGMRGESSCFFSMDTKKKKTVLSFTRLGYQDVVSFAGRRFAEAVSKEGGEDTVSFDEFKTKAALASALGVMTPTGILEFRKDGIWKSTSNEIVIVNSLGCFRPKEDSTEYPMLGEIVGTSEESGTWIRPEVLNPIMIKAKDSNWRRGIYEKFRAILDSWNWENPECKNIVIGAYLATWVQYLIPWRPIIFLTGESNSGKTIFMSMLNKMFLGLANLCSAPTPAGVMQLLDGNSKPILIDEFDTSRNNQEILKLFRSSSRGNKVVRGTADQTGTKQYILHHIPWICGIYGSSPHQADENRMVRLGIKVPKDNEYNITIPPDNELTDLGKSLLACSITSLDQALERFDEAIRGYRNPKVPSRYYESMAILFSFVHALLDTSRKSAHNEIMGLIEYSKTFSEEDHFDLLRTILLSEIRVQDGPEQTASVAEILFDDRFVVHRDIARTKGIGIIMPTKADRTEKVALVPSVAVSHGGILANTDWEKSAGMEQLLFRLPYAIRPHVEYVNIAGHSTKGLVFDYQGLKKWTQERCLGARTLFAMGRNEGEWKGEQES